MRAIPLTILCALVAVTYWIGATFFTNKIEQDITARSNTAIAAYKPAIDLEVDGRDVTLTGKVRDEETRDSAIETVDSVYGVRATRDSLGVMDPYYVHGSYTDRSRFFVDGTVMDRERANATLAETIAPLESVSSLNTGARPLENSGAKIALAAGAVSLLNTGEFWIDEEKVRITGEAPDQQTKEAIEQRLRNQQAMIDPLALVTEIEVTAVTISSRCLAIEGNGLDEVVLFEIDSDYVKDEFVPPLASMIDLTRECIGNIVVEAHADHDGDEDYNFQLSQRRAESVTQILLQEGLDSNMVSSFAYGETRPVASNETREEKSFNRRVVVRFIPEPTDNNPNNHSIISTQSSE